MVISLPLTPEHQAWLDAHVAPGDFAPAEEAACQLLGDRDDLAWAKVHVDEALASVQRNESLSLEEHRARNAARLAALKD